MTKFAAQKLGDLLNGMATAARSIRAETYAQTGTPFVAVVMVEVDDGSWVELDAESEDHARTLADCWVKTMGARGASCRRLRGLHAAGYVELRPFYTRYDTGKED